MKSYLSMIPISAKVHKRQNKMTIWCIVIAVFLVTAVFSMTEMAVRQETARLVDKHGAEEILSLLTSEAFRSLIPIALVLFLFVLCAGIFMIAGSMNSNVARRTQLFGMMRCIGMSKRQIIRYVRLEALNWCKSAIPEGVLLGTVITWILCAVLKYAVGGEWESIPQMRFSALGILSGVIVGLLTVLIAASKPARRASNVTPVSALSGITEQKNDLHIMKATKKVKIEKALGIRHATESGKNLFLMIGSFALSIILFLSFTVIIDLVNCMMPQSAASADVEILANNGDWIENQLITEIRNSEGVKLAFGRRAIFDVEADFDKTTSVNRVDIISYEAFDIEALKKDGILERNCDIEKVINENAAFVISDEAIKKGDKVSVFGTTLELSGRLKYDPLSADGSTEGKTTLIVSDETFKAMTGISDYSLILVKLSKSATDENVNALQRMADSEYNWTDNREYDNHGTYIAFIVCIYSFLVVIALVTILNIVNSISMSVSARVKQYGAMRAVGMSKDQIGSMIKAEALTYSGLGCATGLLIGLIFSKWLYGSLVTAHYAYAQWHVPVIELIVIAVFFLLSVLAGVKGPIKRLNEMSITETIGQL